MYNFQTALLTLLLIICFGTTVAKAGKGNTDTTRKTNVTTKKVTDHCTLDCIHQNDTKRVCGSDGKDYLSYCHLKKDSCLNKNGVILQNRGACDCPESCSKDYKPVCGSNEKTFHNHCQLKKEACQAKGNKTKIAFVKKGPCKPWTGSKCPDGCADIWAPVCAMDGKTYSSVCSMKLASCKSTQRIGLKKIGHCKNNYCPENCPENHHPQCANDHRVYENDCEMRLQACRTKKVTELKKSSKKKLCPDKCVWKCPPHDNIVCGSNSVTYKNECELRRENCKRNKHTYILKKGPCDPAQEIKVLPKIDVGVAPIHAPTLL